MLSIVSVAWCASSNSVSAAGDDTAPGRPAAVEQRGTSRLRQHAAFRPGMTLKDFAAAQERLSGRRKGGRTDSLPGQPQTDNMYSRGSSDTGAADSQADRSPPTAGPRGAHDPGQAWRQYASSSGMGMRPEEASAVHVTGSPSSGAGAVSQRQRPATADLDKYLSREAGACLDEGMQRDLPARRAESLEAYMTREQTHSAWSSQDPDSSSGQGNMAGA